MATTTTTYSRDTVMYVFSNYTDEEIMKVYTRDELAAMYESFNGTVRPRDTKRTLVSTIREVYYTVKRAEALWRPL